MSNGSVWRPLNSLRTGSRDILADEAIRLIGDDTSDQYPYPLRHVVVYRPYDASHRRNRQPESVPDAPEQVIELVTNKAHWDAETVSALYKSRWRIESFFKMIKQRLRIKTFIGTNRNEVMSQIGTAMIVVLLLLHLKNKSNQEWHMSNLVTFIRIHLMSYIDMWEWLKQRFEESHSPP